MGCCGHAARHRVRRAGRFRASVRSVGVSSSRGADLAHRGSLPGIRPGHRSAAGLSIGSIAIRQSKAFGRRICQCFGVEKAAFRQNAKLGYFCRPGTTCSRGDGPATLDVTTMNIDAAPREPGDGRLGRVRGDVPPGRDPGARPRRGPGNPLGEARHPGSGLDLGRPAGGARTGAADPAPHRSTGRPRRGYAGGMTNTDRTLARLRATGWNVGGLEFVCHDGPNVTWFVEASRGDGDERRTLRAEASTQAGAWAEAERLARLEP